MYCNCHKVKALWNRLLQWWANCTSEDLNSNPRTVLLGLRDSHLYNNTTSFPETSLPFTYLRTITLSTIKKERAKLQKGIKGGTVSSMFNTIMQTLQLRANMLYLRAKQWEKWNPQEQAR